MEPVNNIPKYQMAASQSAGPQASQSMVKPEEIAISNRSNAQNIAASRVSKVERPQTTRELKGLSVLDTVFNFTKKIGRGACLLGGLVCSTAAVGSMFFLNVKLLGFMFAIPAALFFFVATNLHESTKKTDDYALVKDPVKSLNDILENRIHYLRENPNQIFKIIQAIEDMPKHNPDYSFALDRLAALREAVLVERAQLINLDDDEQSLMYLGQMDDYLNIINNILPPPNQVAVLEQNQPKDLQSVHLAV